MNQLDRISRAIMRPRYYYCPKRRRRITNDTEIEIVIIIS